MEGEERIKWHGLNGVAARDYIWGSTTGAGVGMEGEHRWMERHGLRGVVTSHGIIYQDKPKGS